MTTIKKFTAIKLETSNIDNIIKISLLYGDITGPYYSKDYPEEEFDSEQEALEYAHNNDKYARWLILPIYKFN